MEHFSTTFTMKFNIHIGAVQRSPKSYLSKIGFSVVTLSGQIILSSIQPKLEFIRLAATRPGAIDIRIAIIVITISMF